VVIIACTQDSNEACEISRSLFFEWHKLLYASPVPFRLRLVMGTPNSGVSTACCFVLCLLANSDYWLERFCFFWLGLELVYISRGAFRKKRENCDGKTNYAVASSPLQTSRLLKNQAKGIEWSVLVSITTNQISVGLVFFFLKINKCNGLGVDSRLIRRVMRSPDSAGPAAKTWLSPREDLGLTSRCPPS